MKVHVLALGIALAIFGATSSEEESKSEDGEESGTQYELDGTYDEIRRGVRLVLNYDEWTQKFEGTIENTTKLE